MTTDAIRSTACELSRIARTLSKIEVLSHRKMTPGRAREIIDLYDSLAVWESTNIRLAQSIGINLCAVVSSGLQQLQGAIDEAHDANRAERNRIVATKHVAH
jgi:hypothetical protein